MPTLASQIAGKERLLHRAIRAAKTLIDAAGKLGIDAPKRRYRRRKKAAEAGPKSTKKAKTSSRTPLKKTREEE